MTLGDQVTQKEVKRFQTVCRARQRQVESTLKAQQLITCMFNILGVSNKPICTVVLLMQSILQTTSDAQNILKDN